MNIFEHLNNHLTIGFPMKVILTCETGFPFFRVFGKMELTSLSQLPLLLPGPGVATEAEFLLELLAMMIGLVEPPLVLTQLTCRCPAVLTRPVSHPWHCTYLTQAVCRGGFLSAMEGGSQST